MRVPGHDRIGSTLHDTYRIERLIAEGGMGSVYEVVHLRLNHRYALKILEHQLAHNDEAYARFRQEAEIAASLAHASIVQVFDFNADPLGNPYMVMELVEGTTFTDFIGGKPLPVRDVMRVMEPLCSALDAAHRAGIVHRDLKPSNVMVRRTGGGGLEVKLLDFGISKMRDTNDGMTRDNVVMGTPNYMSPEQAKGQANAVDATTDIFALGAILYEALTGRRAFEAKGTPELLHAIVYEEPRRLKIVRPELPNKLISVVEKCLAKQPGDRYSSVRELMFALREAMRSAVKRPEPTVTEIAPVQVETSTARPVVWGVAWAVSMAAAAILAAVLVSKPGGRESAASVHHAAAKVQQTPSATDDVEPEPATFSPELATPGARMLSLGSGLYRADGRGLTFWPEADAPPKAAALPSAEPVTALEWASDGSILVGQSDGTVSAWPRDLGSTIWQHRIGKQPVRAMAAGADYLAIATDQGVELYNHRNWRALKRFAKRPGTVELLLTKAPRARLLVVGPNGLEVIDLDQRKSLSTLRLTGRATNARLSSVSGTGPIEFEVDFDQGDWQLRRRYRLVEERRGDLALEMVTASRLAAQAPG